jgi:DivIVA domain-containing protein
MPRKRRQEAAPEPQAPPAEPRRITPVDIQQKEFRLAFRGYHEGEVDQFLDDLTEEVARLHAENKRLREELDFKRTERLDTHAAGASDAILRHAREEAARIVEEARTRASTVGGSGGTAGTGGTVHAGVALLGPFLAREREFLQGLASLIQGHADAVKAGIRRAREEMAAERPLAPTPAEEAEHAQGEELGTERMEAADSSEEEPAEAEPAARSAEPEAASAQAPEGWRSGEPIMDLTEDSVELGDRAREPVAADDREDRSLREFFWGED